jgi:hypothetical protein
MEKRVRKILFLIYLIIFLLAAPVIILYFQGYRFDFEKKSLTQTGGLFLKVMPKQVEIYIDDKLVKKTDWFFGSTLIENLLPKKYKIGIKNEGFYPWEKTLEIKEKEVTEVKNIILFPKNLDFQILTKNLKNFWFSPSGKEIVLFEKGGDEGWALKLYDLEKNVKSHLVDEYSLISTSRYARVIEEKDIYSKGAALLNLEFSEDSKEIYLNVGIGEEERVFALNLEKIPPSLSEKKIPPLSENAIASQNFNGKNYYLDSFGHLFEGEEKLTQNPFSIKPETEYQLNIFSDYIFLRESENLYRFNMEQGSFEKFFEKINDLKISPDNKKLVFFSDSEIWVLFLKEKWDQPTKKAGEKLLITRLSEKIGDVFWLNSNYLIFNNGDKIRISEIDDRDRINIIDIAEFNNPKLFFNRGDKKIYLLSDESLYASVVLF